MSDNNLDTLAASLIVKQPEQGTAQADGRAKDPDLARKKREQKEQSYQRALSATEKLEQERRSSASSESTAGVGDDEDDELSGPPAGQGGSLGATDDRQALTDNDDDDQDDASDPKGDEDDDEDEGDPLAYALGDADHERDAEAEDKDPLDTSKLGDDAKLSVTVDGEERIVTLGELKRRYAGEGAIEKRLQAATETRTKAEEDYQRSTQLTQGVLQQFGQMLFRRTVPAPTQDLLDKNPQQYMRQKAMYDEETASLGQAHQQLYGLMQQVDAQYEENRKIKRQQAAQQLRQIMPVFNDPVKGPKVKAALIDAAKEIGYTDADIAACEDPLMFKTVALAARELKRMKGVKAEPSVPKSRTMKKQNGAGVKVDTAKRQQQAALKRAEKTGSMDDIAASMIVAPPKRQRKF